MIRKNWLEAIAEDDFNWLKQDDETTDEYIIKKMCAKRELQLINDGWIDPVFNKLTS
jgi:hypothetical protein